MSCHWRTRHILGCLVWGVNVRTYEQLGISHTEIDVFKESQVKSSADEISNSLREHHMTTIIAAVESI